jgi:hypothetical protein
VREEHRLRVFKKEGAERDIWAHKGLCKKGLEEVVK